MRAGIFAGLLLATCAPAMVSGGEPAPVTPPQRASFSAKLTAAKAGDGAKISFAVSAPTDVEVAVLDAKGAVVRHLAAGMLGKSAPEPLKKDALAQELVWDGKDDAGKPLPSVDSGGGGFKARVSIGARPRLEKHVGWDGNTLGGVVGVAVGKLGEVYVLSTEYYRGGTDLRVLDKDGRYLRTIMPYSAATPKERTAPVGQLEVDGERLPVVFNGLGKTTHPLTSGMRQQNMAWHPKDHLMLVSALGTMAEHGPMRHLLAVHPEGGAPEGVPFVGPRLRKQTGFKGGAGEGTVGCFDHIATSADGEYVYLSVNGYSRLDGKKHAVYRLKWPDAEPGAPWLGKGEAGADDERFNGPAGLAVDKDGRVYVCDHGNNRVMVFDREGKLLGKFAADKPHQVAVHPATGDIYVLSVNMAPRWGRLLGDEGVLRKFGPWPAVSAAEPGKGEPKEVARLDAKGMNIMALDGASSPARLWLAGAGLVPVTDKGAALEAGASVANGNGLGMAGFISGDPVRNRALIYLYETQKPTVHSLDLATGKRTPFCPGTATALDRDGNVYVMGGRDSTIYRFDPAGKPLPFAGAGSHKIATKGWRGYGPSMGIGGIAVGAGGDIYVMRTSNVGCFVGRVDVYGPDGKLKKEDLVDGLSGTGSGLAVDAAGNVYVGENLKPADAPLPLGFAGKVPDKPWVWWRAKREDPWSYPYCNPYLFDWGAAFKFGPEGGAFYGHNQHLVKDPKFAARPADRLDAAPADSVSLRTSCLTREIKMVGAKWRYHGMGPVPGNDGPSGDPGCVCYNSHLAADPYGRVYVPNVFRFSVEMLDTGGNPIARIGRYGNADSAGPGSKVPEPEIGLVWPAFVSWAGGRVFISDAVNHRVTVVKFDHAAEETVAVP